MLTQCSFHLGVVDATSSRLGTITQQEMSESSATAVVARPPPAGAAFCKSVEEPADCFIMDSLIGLAGINNLKMDVSQVQSKTQQLPFNLEGTFQHLQVLSKALFQCFAGFFYQKCQAKPFSATCVLPRSVCCKRQKPQCFL